MEDRLCFYCQEYYPHSELVLVGVTAGDEDIHWCGCDENQE